MREEVVQEWIIRTIVIVIPSFLMTMMLIALFNGNNEMSGFIGLSIFIVNFMQSQIINYNIYKNEKHK
jgi:hypothetical protein